MLEFKMPPASFHARDYIGAAPKKVGDTFKAQWFGQVARFRVVEMWANGSCMAELVE